MNSTPSPTPPASWIPGTLFEWVIMAIVAAFLYMVKAQNDRILPALAEVVTAIRALPAALRDSHREAMREAAREAAHERDIERAGRA